MYIDFELNMTMNVKIDRLKEVLRFDGFEIQLADIEMILYAFDTIYKCCSFSYNLSTIGKNDIF